MKVTSDLHIHSRFSRATSKSITLKNLEKYARMKGINLLGTGDFTHPKWLEELKNNLKEDGSGILKTESGFPFLLQVELSNIYKQGGKERRIHNVILAPNFEVADQINDELRKRGRLDYDGRPMFGFTCPQLLDILRGIDKRVEAIPAHIWTPWYGLFGSKSGFDSVEECFQDQAKHIHALETGLSSDPAMNWRLSQLDEYNLVSFSDAHSHWPWRIGREATIFEIEEPTYDNIVKAIRTGEGLEKTLEFFPDEGKYHYDGHRKCNVCMDPKKAMENNNRCPKCGKELTLGVLHRVEELADREAGEKPDNARHFQSLIPLSEIISIHQGVDSPYSKKVWKVYNKLLKEFDSELDILLKVPEEKLKKVVRERMAANIVKLRKGKIEMKPGYDGVYGEPVFEGIGTKEREPETEEKIENRQLGISDFQKEKITSSKSKGQKRLSDF